MTTCRRCGREFETSIGLGVHLSHMRKAIARGRANRICPDRTSDEEAREHALRVVRLKARMGLLGRHP